MRGLPSRREDGLSKLEWLGVIGVALTFLLLIPFFRELLGDIVGAVFHRTDSESGELTSFSVAMRGILIITVAGLAFIGTVWLLLYTNLGSKLAFLIIGAAASGWVAINGLLFVAFAPRGIRPENIEGLNAIQFRIPALAMAVGGLILFIMFLVALDRYERAGSE